MKILLTGATGYIGKRLLPILVKQGHEVVCCVRDKNRFYCPIEFQKNVSVIEVDFLKIETLTAIPTNIDAAYYLIHSMSDPDENYDDLEKLSAENFVYGIEKTTATQVIYLSGIVNDKSLSKHLSSRKKVEDVLNSGKFAMTTLRAGIIVGSGSASFEIIRDLVNKLPVMITPKWLNTKCQPIAIPDVLDFLSKSLLNPVTYDKSFDIGGPDILTYKEMLLGFAKAKKLKRWIYTVPIMTPKLSSYWLYFVTSTSYKLASALVSSMKVEVICSDNKINDLLYGQACFSNFVEPVSQQGLDTFAVLKFQSLHSLWYIVKIRCQLSWFLFRRILSLLASVGCLSMRAVQKTKNIEFSYCFLEFA